MATDHRPDAAGLLQMANGFRAACVLGAAAELDLFSVLAPQAMTADETARRLGADLRGTTVLLRVLVGLGLLDGEGGRYAVPETIRPLLVEDSPTTLLPMIRHTMNLVRTWSQLARVVAPASRPHGSRARAGRRPTGPRSSRPCTPFRRRWPRAWWPAWARRSSATCWTWAGRRVPGRWPFCGPCRAR